MFSSFAARVSSRIFVATIACAVIGCGGDIAQPDTHARASSRSVSAKPGDTAILPQDRGTYTLSKLDTGYRLSNNLAANTDQTLAGNIVRLRFADTSLALDINGNAGKAYRLYQAAFNRVPDHGGLGFWIYTLDNGTSLLQVADQFIRSAEFSALYGTNLTDTDFLTKLYNNVLHRAPDAGGLAFWLDTLQQGQSRAAVLVSFAESTENATAVLPGISAGMVYSEIGIAYRPVANAGASQSGVVGTVLTLDGSASSDANGDALAFQWQISARPAGSTAALSSSVAAKPTFKPDLAGQYVLTLGVNDGKLVNANSATVYVNVAAPNVPVIADSGIYKCASLTPATALYLYQIGHTYLDRDKDGLPCEANDIAVELASATPPVIITPTTPSTSGGGMCYVNGYYRRNGTYVSGYYRRC
jgi:hypothetical protein